MICYRDMTFCLEKKCKKWDTCHRAFNEHHEKKQQASGLPFSRFTDRPSCFEVKDERD